MDTKDKIDKKKQDAEFEMKVLAYGTVIMALAFLISVL